MPLETIYLVHHSHTDIGFTHDQDVVRDLHCQFIDQAVDLCEQTADYPDGSALRWTCECTWPVSHWLKHRDDRQVERFLNLERAGRIEVAGMFATLSQCVSHEGLWRQLYPAARLRADYGMNIRSAMQCDINGMHWGLVDALNDAGIENFSMAINENVGRAAFGAIRPNGFHWQSAAGKQVLVWNGFCYNNNQYFGIPDDYGRAVRDLPRFLNWLDQRGYPYPFCMFQATHTTFTDNGPADIRVAEFVRRWNQEGRSPRMEIVTLGGFFDRLRREPAALLPAHRGEWTDYWNVGAASTAYETLLNRGTQRRLVEAEWLSALAPGNGPGNRREDLAKGWELTHLFDEHTWGANVSTTQPWSQASRSQLSQKLCYAHRARSRAQLVRLEAADRLARSVSAPEPGRYVLALNPLPWPRRERLLFPPAWLEGYSSKENRLVLDENEPPVQLRREVHDTVSRVQYMDRNDLGEQQGLGSMQTLTSAPVEVPAMGYTLCSISDLRAEPPGEIKKVERARAESDGFIIEMDAERGGIASLFDKRRSREWIDRAHAQSLGGYVHEEIATAAPDQPYGGRMAIYKESDWSRFFGYGGWHSDWHAKRRGIERIVEQTCQRLPGATRLRQVCEAPGLNSLIYEATIHDDLPYIDLRVTLDKLWNVAPEACYLAFPLDLPGAAPRFETVGGVVEPSVDQLPGCNQDYFTVQGWADWSTDREGMTLCTPDAPIMFFGGFHFARMHDGKRPALPATFLSLVMTNYYHVNYAGAQNGQVTFAYRLCPHEAFDSAWSSRRAREAASPLWGHPVKDPSGPRSARGSLLAPDHPAVDVVACKPAEDGRGIIIRFRNTSPAVARADIALPEAVVRRASLCDGLENAKSELPIGAKDFAIEVPPFATLTCRLE